MKKTIVLLRGLTREKRHWGDFPIKLQESSLVDDVICVDLKGFGDLYSESSPLTISEITKDFLKKIKAKINFSDQNEVYLIGLSLGGMISLEVANSESDEVRKLFAKHIVINSSQKYKTPF